MSVIMQLSTQALEKYASVWEECIGFAPELFYNEICWVVNIYCNQDDREELSGLYREYIKIPPLSEERIPGELEMEAFYNFFIKISSRLPFLWYRTDSQELENLLNEAVKDGKGSFEDTDMIFEGLILLEVIFNKYKEESDFGWTQVLHDTIGLSYTCVRSDLLKLYRYLGNNGYNPMETVTLQIGNGEKLLLHNGDDWFGQMLRAYLNKHLGVADMEEALKELERDYPSAKQRGRKRGNPVLDIVMMGCYNLLRKSGFIPKGVLVSDRAIDFIEKYLKYLGLVGENDDKFYDKVYVRAKIGSLLKIGYKPVWYTFPNIKTDPAEREFMKKQEAQGNVVGLGRLHPILLNRKIDEELKNKGF